MANASDDKGKKRKGSVYAPKQAELAGRRSICAVYVYNKNEMRFGYARGKL